MGISGQLFERMQNIEEVFLNTVLSVLLEQVNTFAGKLHASRL